MTSVRMAIGCMAAALFAVSPAYAAKPAWDQAKNVRTAAERLVNMQKRQGADAVVKFLDACYRTHTLAEKYSEALEGCMAQDLMFSHVLAAVYSRMPPEAKAQKKVLTPEVVNAAMARRLESVASQYKLSDDDRKAFVVAVETHGLPLFMKAMFPAAGAEPAPDTEKKP